MKSNFSGYRIQGFWYCFFFFFSVLQTFHSNFMSLLSENNCIFSKCLCHYYFKICLLMFLYFRIQVVHVLYCLELFSNSWMFSFLSVCLFVCLFFLSFFIFVLQFGKLLSSSLIFFFPFIYSIYWELIKVILHFSFRVFNF